MYTVPLFTSSCVQDLPSETFANSTVSEKDSTGRMLLRHDHEELHESGPERLQCCETVCWALVAFA